MSHENVASTSPHLLPSLLTENEPLALSCFSTNVAANNLHRTNFWLRKQNEKKAQKKREQKQQQKQQQQHQGNVVLTKSETEATAKRLEC